MHKGYKCLDISTGRVYISRDVVFDEHVFPFSKLHPNAGALLRSQILLLPEHLANPDSTNLQDKSLGQLTNTHENSDESDASCRENRHHFMQEPYSVGVQGTSAGHEVDLGASVEQAASGASALDQAPPVSPANESPSATPSSASTPPTRSPARDSDAGPRPTSVPAAPAVGDTSGAATTILTGSSAAVTGSPAEAVHSPRRVTRLQHGIRKPKSYTDGTIRYGCFA